MREIANPIIYPYHGMDWRKNVLEIESVTVREAQYLLGRSQEEINRAIDRGDIEKRTREVTVPAPVTKQKAAKRPRRTARARRARTSVMGHVAPKLITRTVRTLGQPELVYLSLAGKLHEELTPAGRRKLYQAIRAKGGEGGTVVLGPLEVSLAETVKTLAMRFRKLKTLRAGIVEADEHEPVIKGTDISVYVIAALAEGQGVAQTLEDYPGLSNKKVESAIEYARAYPKLGRPYPTLSLKRMTAALAASGAFDLDPETDDGDDARSGVKGAGSEGSSAGQ